MRGVWDYDPKELRKTKAGRLKLLERMINYGPDKGKKIKLSEVKKNCDKLDLFEPSRRLMELLIWGKYRSSPNTKKKFWMR
jgi:hypothetical protein